MPRQPCRTKRPFRSGGPKGAGTTAVETLEEWTSAVKEALVRIETYNMTPQTAVESLYYRTRDAARQGDSP